ncbi:MAG: hypothetical protein ABEJ07_04965, partial [Candidatus Nanohaloarchaea archaeon]
APSIAAVDTAIRPSCHDDEEALVSLNDTSGGHLGEPGFYDSQLCARGVSSAAVRQTCRSDETQLFSLFSRNNSHFSIYPEYRYDVCVESGLQTAVRPSCPPNETAALSVFSDNNSHAGGMGSYDRQLCFYREAPENITLQLSGIPGDFYADNQATSVGETFRLAEYPYIVSEQGGTTRGVVSYGGFVKLSRPSPDIASVTQTGSSFLLPFFSGGHAEIEDEQEQVNSRRFLELLSPSFSYTIPTKPRVKVLMRPDRNIVGFRDTLSGQVELTVSNEGLNSDDTLEIRLKEVS